MMMAMDLRTVPKVELHSHLDCCLSFGAAATIAPSLTRARYDADFVAPARCASLAEYLPYTLNYRALLQTEAALRVAVGDVFAQMAAENVVYAELRFAPLAQTEGGLAPEQVVEAVADETARQIAATGVEASLILCTLRHFSPAASLATAELVGRYAGSSAVAALDIAGDEAGAPLAPHLPAFDHVRGLGLPITVHAGEAAGPASVREALDRTGTRRLGHGVRSVEDPALVGRLRDEGIHLEVCPASNYQTNVVDSPDDHPVDRLYRAGVALGLSTDTRAVTDVTLTDEYAGVVDRFGWTLDDLRATNQAALAAAFAAEDVRARVATRLAEGFDAAASG